jgi:hypothetical protein
MHRGKLFPILFLFMVTGLFLYGVTHLLVLRFEKGDVYPPYCSFRTDPLGTKAFYEALCLLPNVETTRNVEPLEKASGLSDAALFLFGLKRYHFSVMEQAFVKALEDVALGGGRIVISFFPTQRQPAPRSEDKGKKDPRLEENPDKQKEEEQDEEEEKDLYHKEYVDLCKRWSVETGLSAEKDAQANLSGPEKNLPATLAWHSTLFLEPLDDAWRTIYIRAGKPVLIERSFGKGSVVLLTDSFLLSNEAMKSKRYPHFLSWLCGTHKKIIFDETHLGVQKSPGIATLLRKYGLAPFIVSLLVLAILAIWKQSARFIPAYEEGGQALVDPGKDSSAGLTNLLRRNISLHDILPACLEEWRRSFTHGKQNLSGLLPRIQEIIAEHRAQPRKKRNPVLAYRKISALRTRR